MHAGNLLRRFDRRHAGRKRMLTGAVLTYIKRWLNGSPQRYKFEAGSWQINMVLEKVRERFGISCEVRTLRRVLKRLGFSYRKPRPIPDKSASKEEQEKFKQETAKILDEMIKQGHVVQVCDEAAVQIWSGTGYGWRPVNGHDTIRQGFSKKSRQTLWRSWDGRVPHTGHRCDQLGDVHRIPAGSAQDIPQIRHGPRQRLVPPLQDGYRVC